MLQVVFVVSTTLSALLIWGLVIYENEHDEIAAGFSIFCLVLFVLTALASAIYACLMMNELRYLK